MRSTPRTAEGLVLVVGLLSAGGLGFVSLRSWGNPEAIARVEMERDARQAAEAMRLDWEGRARTDLGGAIHSGSITQLTPIARLEVDDRQPRQATGGIFDLALSDVEDAADVEKLREALRDHPNAPRRPEGWLRLVQLLVQEDPGGAASAWAEAMRELEPQIARGDVSYRLLVTLAAGECLTKEVRANAQRSLAADWLNGTLAIPEPTDIWVAGQVEFDPRFEVYVQALEGLSAENVAHVRLAAGHDARTLRALYQFLGSPELPIGDGRWRRLLDSEWLIRRDATDLAFARRPAEELAATLARDPFFLVGDGEASGETVNIAGTDWNLLHSGLEDWVHVEEGRLRTLRLGFGVLALLAVAATGATYAALVRRRRLDGLKSRFIAGVSHDLRTPLASILLMAENLESGRVTNQARQSEYHGAIRREATRLRRMVDDVLDFSRIERGAGAKLAREEVDLPALAKGLEQEAGERVAQGGASLSTMKSDLPDVAWLDEDAVRRMVGNLIGNALAHSGSKEIGIQFRVEGTILFIEVSDNGVGVAPERRGALFAPFRQGTGSEHHGGSGLGLAIVRELARAHGGDAEFLDCDVGACVRLTLPLQSPE